MYRLFCALFILAGAFGAAEAQQPPATEQTPAQTPAPAEDPAGTADSAATPEHPQRDARLADYLNGCKFIGRFTIDGSDDPGTGKPEEYTIIKCEKLPQGDLFRLTARIRYGEVDSEVPMDLPIRWSGNTPVITLDSLWIPTLGTFSARVLIHSDRYAGTWQHDDKGGHLFGRIEKLEAQP